MSCTKVACILFVDQHEEPYGTQGPNCSRTSCCETPITLRFARQEKQAMNYVASRSSPPSIIRTEKPLKKASLLDRLGGPPALDNVIDGLYFRVMADDDLAMFFGDVDLRALKAHQKHFLSMAFAYKVPQGETLHRRLFKAHKRLFAKGLNEFHYDKVAGHLVASLKELLVDRSVIQDVISVLLPFRELFEEDSETRKKVKKRFGFKEWRKRQTNKVARWLK